VTLVGAASMAVTACFCMSIEVRLIKRAQLAASLLRMNRRRSGPTHVGALTVVTRRRIGSVAIECDTRQRHQPATMPPPHRHKTRR